MSNEPTVKRWTAKRKAAVVMGIVMTQSRATLVSLNATPCYRLFYY